MTLTVTHIQLCNPTDIFHQPSLSRVSSAQFAITDFPGKRYVRLDSRDERHGGKSIVIPYENVKAISYTQEGVDALAAIKEGK
jgi:hypothetical protein